MDKLGPIGIGILKRFLKELHSQRDDLQRLVMDNGMRIYGNDIDVTHDTINRLEKLITRYSRVLERPITLN